MNKEEFIQKMRTDKKSKITITRNIEYTETFESYLSDIKDEQLENATPKDLENFKLWGEKNKLKNLRLYFWSIATYFAYLKKKQMVLKANELIGLIELNKYKLNEFRGINKNVVEKLKKNNIKTARQILEIGNTKDGRNRLAKTTNIPVENIVELVKLSDLARIPGVKKIRARLYYEAGLDTLEKIAGCDAQELRNISAKYIRKTSFNGIPPTLKEAEHTVTMAAYLSRRGISSINACHCGLDPESNSF